MTTKCPVREECEEICEFWPVERGQIANCLPQVNRHIDHDRATLLSDIRQNLG